MRMMSECGRVLRGGIVMNLLSDFVVYPRVVFGLGILGACFFMLLGLDSE
jgi:hypothetical protein